MEIKESMNDDHLFKNPTDKGIFFNAKGSMQVVFDLQGIPENMKHAGFFLLHVLRSYK